MVCLRTNPNVVAFGEADEGGVEGRKVRVECLPFLMVGVTSTREREEDEEADESGVDGLRMMGEGALGRLKDKGFINSFLRVEPFEGGEDSDVWSPALGAKLTCLRTPNRLVNARVFLFQSPEEEEDALEEMEADVKALTSGPVGTRPTIAL